MPTRVCVTDAAAALLRRLRREHGELLLHLSGGCCEGSAPMCLRRSGFRIGARDILLGVVEDCPFYVAAMQFPYWAYCQLTLDVTRDGGDSFSLEAADGVRLLVRSRLFTDAECNELDAAGPPPTGPDAAASYLSFTASAEGPANPVAATDIAATGAPAPGVPAASIPAADAPAPNAPAPSVAAPSVPATAYPAAIITAPPAPQAAGERRNECS